MWLLMLVCVVGLLGFPATASLAATAEKGINWWNMAMQLFGGLAIFLFGMEQMAVALKKVAGDRMKTILAKLTTNRIMGLVTGAFVTAVIQSSSVTTVMLVGFVTAGLMSLSQAVGVILGADIGTTITAQIVAFKVTKYALILVAIGFLLLFTGKTDKLKQNGALIMGLGFIFFGKPRRLLVDAFGQLAAQFRNIGVTGLQNLMHLRNVENRKQQVLDRHEFVTVIAGTLKCLVHTEFKLATEHSIASLENQVSSIVHSSGC